MSETMDPADRGEGRRAPGGLALGLRLLIVLCCLLMVSGQAVWAQGGGAAGQGGKKVLIIHSYYKGFLWTDEEHLGITSVLAPAVGMENIYVEYLDSKRFYRDDYLVQLSQVFRKKYRSYRPDLVVVTDNNAFDFIRRFGEELFPGTPVVFCGVNEARAEDLVGHPSFTGVSEEADLKGSLDVALALQPRTQFIHVVNDSTETGQIVGNHLRVLAPSYPQVRFVFLDGLSMAEILAQLKTLPPHSIVFHTFFSRDVTGRLFEYKQSMELVAGAAQVPVFGAWDFNLGHGLAGGMLTSGAAQGEAAARIALRVMAGERPADIPIQRETPGRLIFDYNALAKFQIPLASLPKGSQVINLPESLLIRHRNLLVTLAGTVVLLVTIIAILSANISRRRQAEEDLLKYQVHLEELVQQRSAQLQAANQELKRDFAALEKTQSALSQAESKLRSIFDNAAEGIYQSNPEGRFLTVNPALARMAGYSGPEAMKKGVRDLRRDFYVDPGLRMAFEARLTGEGEVHGHESQVRRMDGSTIWILENARAKRNERGELEHIDGIIQDITGRRRGEEALRNSQEILNKTFASLLDALFIVNAGERTIRDCNPATRQLFGFEREELLGRSARILHVDEASYETLEARALEAFSEKGFLHLPNFQMRRKNGDIFVSELAMMPLRGKDGLMTSWVCVVRDITEQRQMEAKLDLTRRKLRALAAELTLLEEKERRTIATQLHDQLGAVLAMGKVKVATILQAAAGTPFAGPLEEVQALIGEAVNETRSLTWELSPPILYQLGLSAAVEWLCEENEKKHHLAVRFSQVGEALEITEELRFLVFSAVRELFLNIVKHAEAKQVSVMLAWTEESVLCRVQDDGKGFVMSEVEPLREARRSFGLFNIQERVAELDGRVEITSLPGEGTTVLLVLPLGI
ncbi:PAS domain S-box protein [Holophaga foetida]|uniref:sensor histidine kinase n=1 Tax=Holophaga foetida TaxID=35839 RepID=UPI0002E6C384|nr:PAS domain S-box protein [Holophaga foetida]